MSKLYGWFLWRFLGKRKRISWYPCFYKARGMYIQSPTSPVWGLVPFLRHERHTVYARHENVAMIVKALQALVGQVHDITVS